jgi:beta-1,2-mannobiose phosphorylase / 1,2-beta-oligomannan phosphorylase
VIKLNRYEGNPILEPIDTHKWESRLVFNAAALYAKKQIHLIYRAMGNDHISRLGYAVTTDGYHIDERLPYPIFEPSTEQEIDGVEDPRVTLLDETVLMAYTAFWKSCSRKSLSNWINKHSIRKVWQRLELGRKAILLPRHPQQKWTIAAQKNKQRVYSLSPV